MLYTLKLKQKFKTCLLWKYIAYMIARVNALDSSILNIIIFAIQQLKQPTKSNVSNNTNFAKKLYISINLTNLIQLLINLWTVCKKIY